jgi:hypothetical protein
MQAVQVWFSQHSPFIHLQRAPPLSILRQTHKLVYFLIGPLFFFSQAAFRRIREIGKSYRRTIYFWIETCLAGRVFIFSGMEVEGWWKQEGGWRESSSVSDGGGARSLPPNLNPNHCWQGSVALTKPRTYLSGAVFGFSVSLSQPEFWIFFLARAPANQQRQQHVADSGADKGPKGDERGGPGVKHEVRTLADV